MDRRPRVLTFNPNDPYGHAGREARIRAWHERQRRVLDAPTTKPVEWPFATEPPLGRASDSAGMARASAPATETGSSGAPKAYPGGPLWCDPAPVDQTSGAAEAQRKATLAEIAVGATDEDVGGGNPTTGKRASDAAVRAELLAERERTGGIPPREFYKKIPGATREQAERLRVALWGRSSRGRPRGALTPGN